MTTPRDAIAGKELGQRTDAELESMFGDMYFGWDRGMNVTQERFGSGDTRFTEAPMTPLELAARYVAAEIGANIYEIAGRAAFAPIIVFSQIQARIGPVFEEAATQLDSLQLRLDNLASVVRGIESALNCSPDSVSIFDAIEDIKCERDALQARVKELEEERACLKEGTSTAYSAMKKAIKLCQIDLKTDDWQNEDKSRRDLRLAIFRELDIPLAIVGNTERGGGPEKFCSSRLVEAESRALRAEQGLDAMNDNHRVMARQMADIGRALTKAEQERDEAYERAAGVADSFSIGNDDEYDQSDIGSVTCARSIAAAIRRLAGPEKEKKE